MTPSKMTKVNLQVWLQCRMGLCSATNAGAGGNILRCLTTIMTTMMLTTRRITTTMMMTTRRKTKNDGPDEMQCTRCIEPSTSCRAGAPPHQESTLQQVGPFHQQITGIIIIIVIIIIVIIKIYLITHISYRWSGDGARTSPRCASSSQISPHRTLAARLSGLLVFGNVAWVRCASGSGNV